jgi:hypothetical protein
MICELIDSELDAVCGGNHGNGRAAQDFTPGPRNVTFDLGNTIDITGGSGSSSVTINGGVNGGSNTFAAEIRDITAIEHHLGFHDVTFNLGNTIDITGGSDSSSVTVNGGVNGGSNHSRLS